MFFPILWGFDPDILIYFWWFPQRIADLQIVKQCPIPKFLSKPPIPRLRNWRNSGTMRWILPGIASTRFFRQGRGITVQQTCTQFRKIAIHIYICYLYLFYIYIHRLYLNHHFVSPYLFDICIFSICIDLHDLHMYIYSRKYTYLFYRSIYLIYLSIYRSIDLSIYQSITQSIYLCLLYACGSVYQLYRLSIWQYYEANDPAKVLPLRIFGDGAESHRYLE